MNFSPEILSTAERVIDLARQRGWRIGAAESCTGGLLMGALTETFMISGFKSMDGYDVNRHHFEDWRELVAYGNITWPDKPPAALGDVTWDEPEPYVHIHMSLSGGPGKNEEVLVGHLSGGILKGAMKVQIFELLDT